MVEVLSADRGSADSLLSSKDIVGNKVVSVKGRDAGSVEGFFFEDDSVVGLEVAYDTTMYFVDISYVTEYTKEAVMLSIQPFYVLEGLNVYDDAGRYLGTATDVTRQGTSNALEEIVVKRHMFSKALSIPASDIDTAHDSIMLSYEYDNE